MVILYFGVQYFLKNYLQSEEKIYIPDPDTITLSAIFYESKPDTFLYHYDTAIIRDKKVIKDFRRWLDTRKEIQTANASGFKQRAQIKIGLHGYDMYEKDKKKTESFVVAFKNTRYGTYFYKSGEQKKCRGCYYKDDELEDYISNYIRGKFTGQH